MTALVFKLVGGIGLFLLGMVLLTDGLKAFAGDIGPAGPRPQNNRSFATRANLANLASMPHRVEI